MSDFFSQGIIGQLFGGNKNAGRDAARAEREGQRLGIEELRRQFDLTRSDLQGVRGEFDPFAQAGTQALEGLQQGSTQQGLEERLAAIFSGEGFQRLRGERETSLRGQQAATGLSRSGEGLRQIANVPTDLGFSIEQLLTGRQQNLASGGLQALGGKAGLALGQGSFGAGASGGIAELLRKGGESKGAGILTDEQARAEKASQAINLASKFLLASDPSLKENVEGISHIRDLKIYSWDWIPELEGLTMNGQPISEMPRVGCMADEVQELYPQHVYSFGGILTIDYAGLLNELERLETEGLQ